MQDVLNRPVTAMAIEYSRAMLQQVSKLAWTCLVLSAMCVFTLTPAAAASTADAVCFPEPVEHPH